jgi:hypothetical protein
MMTPTIAMRMFLIISPAVNFLQLPVQSHMSMRWVKFTPKVQTSFLSVHSIFSRGAFEDGLNEHSQLSKEQLECTVPSDMVQLSMKSIKKDPMHGSKGSSSGVRGKESVTLPDVEKAQRSASIDDCNVTQRSRKSRMDVEESEVGRNVTRKGSSGLDNISGIPMLNRNRSSRRGRRNSQEFVGKRKTVHITTFLKTRHPGSATKES